jgi:hypothetical protein
MIRSFDETLRLIIKLMQSSVVFRAFEDIFALWLSGVVQFCKMVCVLIYFLLNQPEMIAAYVVGIAPI